MTFQLLSSLTLQLTVHLLSALAVQLLSGLAYKLETKFSKGSTFTIYLISMAWLTRQQTLHTLSVLQL